MRFREVTPLQPWPTGIDSWFKTNVEVLLRHVNSKYGPVVVVLRTLPPATRPHRVILDNLTTVDAAAELQKFSTALALLNTMVRTVAYTAPCGRHFTCIDYAQIVEGVPDMQRDHIHFNREVDFAYSATLIDLVHGSRVCQQLCNNKSTEVLSASPDL